MKEHFHKDDQGILVRCYHQCKHWLSPGFLAGWLIASTITFPLEHIQWDHIWPFDYVGNWLDHTGPLQMWIAYIWVITFILCCVLGILYAIRHKDR